MSYPSPADISYDENSQWCYDHGHTGMLIGCPDCDVLIATDSRFARLLGTVHNPDSSKVERETSMLPRLSEIVQRADVTHRVGMSVIVCVLLIAAAIVAAGYGL